MLVYQRVGGDDWGWDSHHEVMKLVESAQEDLYLRIGGRNSATKKAGK
jgi:hypothetical protein